MSAAEEATAERPRRKRAPWSLKSIVVDVTGRPISEFQNDAAPANGGRSASAGRPYDIPVETDDIDPVERVTPPLSGANARRYHAQSGEHHLATMDRHRPAVGSEGSPANRPERIYLHYLLLHLDRLSVPALWYLRRQVNEELSYRARPKPRSQDPPPTP